MHKENYTVRVSYDNNTKKSTLELQSILCYVYMHLSHSSTWLCVTFTQTYSTNEVGSGYSEAARGVFSICS